MSLVIISQDQYGIVANVNGLVKTFADRAALALFCRQYRENQ